MRFQSTFFTALAAVFLNTVFSQDTSSTSTSGILLPIEDDYSSTTTSPTITSTTNGPNITPNDPTTTYYYITTITETYLSTSGSVVHTIYSKRESSSIIDDIRTFTGPPGVTSTPTPTHSTSAFTVLTSTTITPQFNGVLATDGSAFFDLDIPAALGPWNGVQISIGGDLISVMSHAEYIDGVPISPFNIQTLPTGIVMSITQTASTNLEAIAFVTPTSTATGEVVATAVIYIERSGNVVKRDILSFTVLATASGIAIETDSASTSDSTTASVTSSASDIISSDITSSQISSSSSSSSSAVSSVSESSSSSVVNSDVSSSSSSSMSSDSSSTLISSTESTSTATVTKQSSTVITITSCSDSICTKVPVTTGVTVITTTAHGIETVYTTYCPLTTSVATVSDVLTTVITITSCSDNMCTKVPVTTTVTKASSRDITNKTTDAPVVSESGITTVPEISSFEGAADKLIGIGGAVAAFVLPLLML